MAPDVPNANRVIRARRRQHPAVAAIGHRVHAVGVADQRRAARRGERDVPESDRAVFAHRGEHLAVGPERDAVDLVDVTGEGAPSLRGLLATFHRRIVSSAPPEASVLPSGLNAIVDTAPTWPVSGAGAAMAVQRPTTGSCRRLRPTRPRSPEGRRPRSTRHWCDWLAASRAGDGPRRPTAAPSIVADRHQPPTVRANATPCTPSVWPVSGAPSRRWVATSHSRIRSSPQPAAIVRPSGLNARALT